MKNIVKILSIISVITIYSCNKPINKSVIEPIPIEELKTIIDKDTLFEITYKTVQRIRESKLTDDIERAKWSDMTYKRVHNVILLYNDSLAQNQYTKKIKEDWDLKHGKYIKKSDSIIDYWRKYIQENSINSYAKIDLFDTQTQSDGNVKIGFRITPLKGNIDKISMYYSFIEKDDKDKILSFKRHPSIYDEKSYFYNSNKIEASKIIWETDDKFKGIIENKLLEEVLDDYVFEFDIRSLTANGVDLSGYSLIKDVPSNVESFIEDENEYRRESIIREYINKDFIRYSKYKNNKIDSISKAIYPEVHKFFNLL